MSKFTVKNTLIEVEISYIELEDEEILLVGSDDDKSLYGERLKTAKAWFERPKWSNFNKYIKGCVDFDPITGIPTLDTLTLRDRKFRNLLKKLVDGDGEEVFIDEQFFNNVIPEFAIALVKGYDEKLEKEKDQILLNDEFIQKIFEERRKEFKKQEDNSENPVEETVEKSNEDE